jgi:midasin
MGGHFEWTNGLLIKAVNARDCVLFDNVNFCNSSIQDRLYSLLEVNDPVLVLGARGTTPSDKNNNNKAWSRGKDAYY